jgi:hypothetical protein
MQLESYVEGNQVVTRAICLTPHTVGSVDEGSTQLTVRDPAGLSGTDPVVVEDAGHEGGHLFTTISSVAGNVITLSAPAQATVRRVLAGKLEDPGTAVFTARNGDAAPVTYDQDDPEVTNPSVGVWELRLVSAEGEWRIHFQGTTPCHCAAEGGYRIPHSRAKG